MDMADRASMVGDSINKVDPLRGIDLGREYELILKQESSLHTRIQQMIVNRVEKNI